MPTERAAAVDLAARLRLRARLYGTVREFFAARGVVEVDTPALSAAANPDPAVEPIGVTPASLGRREHWLQTSPELPMKRLLAAGSGDIFQLCRVFRDQELGRWHEPEFMLLEWYRLGFDEHRLMSEVADLLNACLALDGRRLPVETRTYGDLCSAFADVDPHTDDAARLRDRLAASGIDVPPGLPAAACMDLLFATLIVPALPAATIVFVHDYPVSQAALARLKPTDPPVAARFEVFVDGIELGNGFSELTDPIEQRRRFARDSAARREAGRPTPAVDEDFLAALTQGLPDCAGVALGFDRLVAIIAGARRLADVVNFPHAGV